MLRDLRDCYGVPIPPHTEAYRGPRGQVLLHFPSTHSAVEVLGSQDQWLRISHVYALEPFDPRASHLSSSERRGWIREMRRVRGTDDIFPHV